MNKTQKRAARVSELLNGELNFSARVELINYISQAISYHTSGKIEGLRSLDVACSNCRFCKRMQAEADPGQVCTYCYTSSMWDSAKQAHAITGEILSRLELTAEEAAAVSIPASCAMFRFNSDGELINKTHAINLVRIAAAHPETTFSIWTKRPWLLSSVIDEEGKPENLLIGFSSHNINIDWDFIPPAFIDFIFTVYTPRGIEAPIKRGDIECNGKKCLECGFKCYRKPLEIGPHPVRVAEALRRPRNMKKTDFEKLCAMIDERTL